MIRAGIIGGAGYTAGELTRLLLNHPEAEIKFVHSTSHAGHALAEVHEGLIGETDLRFTDSYDLGAVDVLFLCQGHGFSQKFWEENEKPAGLKIVDLAQDFRDESEGYVYGLPEVNASRIAGAEKVANPGCFATAIQLALLPLAAAGELKGKEAHVTGITGSTGAGVKPGATTHFSWRLSNMSVYKAFEHQHLKEIGQTLAQAGGEAPVISFIPMRGDFARGIFVTAYIDSDLSAEEAVKLYRDYYAGARFTFVSDKPVDLKQVVNTNKCVISVEKHGGKLLVLSAIDNLLKGASGQAVQNMNLMFGLDETAGLRLKPSAF